MFLVSLQEFCPPEFLITKKVTLSRATARERVPLHVVAQADILGERIIETRMSSCGWNDGRQLGREFFRHCPLIEYRVRTTPHRNFAVTQWLFCEPLYYVVSISCLIYKRLEFAAGISATANIDERECVAMRREVSAA